MVGFAYLFFYVKMTPMFVDMIRQIAIREVR